MNDPLFHQKHPNSPWLVKVTETPPIIMHRYHMDVSSQDSLRRFLYKTHSAASSGSILTDYLWKQMGMGSFMGIDGPEFRPGNAWGHGTSTPVIVSSCRPPRSNRYVSLQSRPVDTCYRWASMVSTQAICSCCDV